MSAKVSGNEEEAESVKRCRVVSSEEREGEDLCRKKLKSNGENKTNRYELIPEIPHVQLSLEQMNSDPVVLLGQFEEKYREFGAVRLTVSQRWNCPFTFRYVDKGITTRIQCLQDLKYGKLFEQNVEAYSIQNFEKVALNFEHQYNSRTHPQGLTIAGRKQQEYWSLATNPLYEGKSVKVQYAADLPSSKYGSGFPTGSISNWKDADFVYEKNLFNLNNIKNSPSSVLRMAEQRKERISGITHPWVYMGMQFSTFCWHVEDFWVNSLNYNHKGSVKTWYVIPGAQKEKFDAYVRKTYCTKSSKKTLLNRITFMVDPLELIDNGISVYKAYQSPRDYVCTFFKAYHCGFSQGFNVGEAVNFLSPRSIPIMQEAELFKKQQEGKFPNVFPLDWLIHENYKDLNSFTDPEHIGILQQAFIRMVDSERSLLEATVPRLKLSSVEVFPDKTKYDKYQCSVCKEYLFLHAFQSQAKKVFCAQHLQGGEAEEDTVYKLLVRGPIGAREGYITTLIQQYSPDSPPHLHQNQDVPHQSHTAHQPQRMMF